MELTNERVWSAYNALSSATTRKLRLPRKGAYWLSRLEAVLKTDFLVLAQKRDDLVKEFGSRKKLFRRGPGGEKVLDPSGEPETYEDYSVDDGEGFALAWKELMGETVTIANLKPVALSKVLFADSREDDGLSLGELVGLGELIYDDEPGEEDAASGPAAPAEVKKAA